MLIYFVPTPLLSEFLLITKDHKLTIKGAGRGGGGGAVNWSVGHNSVNPGLHWVNFRIAAPQAVRSCCSSM